MALYPEDPLGRFQWLGYDRLSEGFFTVDQVRLRHLIDSGQMSEELTWYLLHRPDAVCAVVYNTDHDSVYFVRQFRLGMAVKEPDPWSIELTAGIVDPGETSEQAICREIYEELGFEVSAVTRVRAIFPSPAILSERIILYYVEVTDVQRRTNGGGTVDEHEDLEIIEVPVRELRSFVAEKQLSDAKTLIGIAWFLSERAAT